MILRRFSLAAWSLAVVNVFFGLLGLLIGGVNFYQFTTESVSGFQPEKGSTRAVSELHFFQQTFLSRLVLTIPSLSWVEAGKGLAMLVLGILLILVGIGCVNFGPRVRKLALGYCLCTLVLHLAYLVYDFTVIQPVIEDLLVKSGAFQNPPSLFSGMNLATLVPAGLFMGHAFILLLLMLLLRPEPEPEPAASPRTAGGKDRRQERDLLDEEEIAPEKPRAKKAVKGPKAAPPVSPEPKKASPTASGIRFHCPSCNRKLLLPESARGKKIRCPSCKATVEAPAG
ncbi:MAG: hypothetical protein JO112_01105 [Planctomycetes bacterium]|nr:hypothetical protein [Planctomycetota bacterium]